MKRATTHQRSSGYAQAIHIWLKQHTQAFVFSLGQMARNPLGSLLTTAVIGVSLSLPAGFYLVLDNARRGTSDWGGAAQITLFLKQDIDERRAESMARELADHSEITEVRLIHKTEALEEFKQNPGFAEALAALDENPLPAVLLLQPSATSITSGQGEQLLEYLITLGEVDSAQFDRQWAHRLFAIIELFQRAVIILATLLAFAVLLIVGNTIRLAIYNRRAEIEINKLFGATDAFIQRPFLYSGLIHGVGGSIMAWLLLLISIELLDAPVLRLSGLYFSDFQLINLSAENTLILFVSGGILGLIGSWVAVQRHLQAIGLK